MLRAHISTGGTAAIVAPGTGTAHRVVEQLRDADVAAVCLEPGEEPGPGVVGVLRDLSGSYTLPFYGCIALELIASVLVMLRGRAAGPRGPVAA